MTPEAQRIAIHAAQGWQKYDGKQEVECMWAPGHISSVVPEWFRVVNGCIEFSIQAPIYENDLNAMRPVEVEHINERGDYMYLMNLHDVVVRDTPGKGFSALMATATAAQRAEAFLRTLDLWKDEA